MKTYTDQHGKPSPLPVGYEAAKKHQTARYIGLTQCPECGGRVRYTRDQECHKCSCVEASDLYAYTLDIMNFVDLDDHDTSTSYRRSIGNRDVPMVYKTEIQDTSKLLGEIPAISAAQAKQLGNALWIRPTPCSKKSHYGIRTQDGKCFFCEWERQAGSPRQAAIAAGHDHYRPVKPCQQCGQHAPRITDTGRCTGCLGLLDGRHTHASMMMVNNPGMTMTKGEAQRLGLTVYRTGQPCKRNHRAWRYVSTGNCIDCHRGVPAVSEGEGK